MFLNFSQEYRADNKNMVPLRIVNNVMTSIMESNSNETGDEGLPLNTKNLMIVSEDSSEWRLILYDLKTFNWCKLFLSVYSQDFIATNEDQAPLAVINDADILTEEEKELPKTEVEAADINYTVIGDANELK